MRIASLVPSATEALFALGLGDDVVAVTHECDWPDAARELPQLTRSVIAPDLSPAEIDAAVRELTARGEAIYELDERALERLAPDLIVTQAVCAVCAVSYEEVCSVAAGLPGGPRVLSLDPETLEEVLADLPRLAAACEAVERGERLRGELAERVARVRGGGRWRAPAAGAGARVARPAVSRRALGAGDDRGGGRRGPAGRARGEVADGRLGRAPRRPARGGGGDAVRPLRRRGRCSGP